jgi:mono/diheme cytochrome c family protein
MRKLSVVLLVLLAAAMTACNSEQKPKSDAELHLNAQQAHGRRVYDQYCLECHEAYNSGGQHGPAMQAVFHKKYLPSGAPANDDRVRDAILMGRAKMPGFRDALTDQDVDDLIAYMHTL